jgi:hypothetical protein
VLRDTGKHSGTSIIFVSTKIKTEFYIVEGNKQPIPMDFLSAIKFLKAKPEELPAPFDNEETHFNHVNLAIDMFKSDLQQQTDSDSIKTVNLDKTAQTADAFLRKIEQICDDTTLKSHCNILRGYLKQGTYSRLPKVLKAISQEYKNNRLKIKEDTYILQTRIGDIVSEYHNDANSSTESAEIGNPKIIISETFK